MRRVMQRPLGLEQWPGIHEERYEVFLRRVGAVVGSVPGDDLVLDRSAGRIAGGIDHLVGEMLGVLPEG